MRYELKVAGAAAIALLSDVRFQAARVKRTASLPERALLMNAVLADGRALGPTSQLQDIILCEVVCCDVARGKA